MIGDSESEAIWSEFFAWLKAQGLNGVDVVVSEHHKGLVNAVQTYLQGASWQRCQTHFIRSLLDTCSKAMKDEFHGRLRLVFDVPNLKTARPLKDELVRDYASRAPRALERIEERYDDAMAVMVLPTRYRKRLRTTNGVERLKEEIRCRERVIGIPPTRHRPSG